MLNNFSINLVLYSIGKKLKELFNKPVYINPNQQSTDLPCFFVQLIPNNHIKQIIGKRYLYELSIDIIYLIDYNNNNSYTNFYDIIDILDAETENIDLYKVVAESDEPVKVGSVGCLEKSFSTELGKMSYKFRIPIMTKLVDSETEELRTKLKRVILNLSIKEKGANKDGKSSYKIAIER